MNFKNLTIGKMVAVGFGVVLALLTLVGFLSYTGVGGTVTNAGLVIDGNMLDGVLAQKEVDHLNWTGKVTALLTDENVTELNVQVDDHKCGFGEWLYGEGRKEAEILVPSIAPLLKEVQEPHRKLHESAIAIGKVFKQANAQLPTLFAEREIDHLKWAARIRDTLLRESDSLDVQTDPTKCALGKWVNSEEAKTAYTNAGVDYKREWNNLLGTHEELHQSAIEIQKSLKISQEAARTVFEKKTLSILSKTLGQLEELQAEAEHELQGMFEANKVYAAQTIPALGKVRNLLREIRTEARSHIMTDEVMLNAAQGTRRNVSIVGVAAVIVGLLLAFFIARRITTVLQQISAQMDEGADQVASASGQVSASSQSLSEGSSEQAASIEETSSSLEEMASMTKQNAENAGQADNLMAEANQVVGKANNSMTELTGSMQEISKASEETSKIIKTIDEIAFQTNLLALNAAVEAARAGEAGAGFAVVADEVRNLAMRAADAAKNTAELIEGTVKKVKDGGDLVATTNEAFTQVTESASKVGELVGEIAAASNEQAQGIEQVNLAVTEMDKVVQQNAASAEESASASEEMNAQAEQMKGIVHELVTLVGGNSKGNGAGGRKVTRLANAAAYRRLPVSEKQPTGQEVAVHRAREVKPDQVIPLDEQGDLKDF